MAQDDLVSEIARLPFPEMLNRTLALEYRFIVSYPRLIDRMVDVEKTVDKESEVVKILKQLGQESVYHCDYVMRIIRALGGEPTFNFEIIADMPDIVHHCEEQLEREMLTLAIYRRAKSLAEDRIRANVWHRVANRLASLLFRRASQPTTKGPILELLEKLIAAERSHVEKMDKVIRILQLQR
ncbi:MAG: hypothetical protein HY676_05050 [Chloroflexi bacterium]|nr:hypothetical protein [Chloroflexota bacterium]